MRRLIGFILLLVPFFIAANAPQPRIVIQTGHSGEVRSISRQETAGITVSAGRDGSLRVWRNGVLLYNRQVSHLPLSDLIIHPEMPVAAFISTDSINTYRLSVYNWIEDRELYSIRIKDAPLSLGFSPKGSYLFYSRADRNSLTILDARTGSPLDIAAEGLGIVSAAFISNTESTMVCYLPSGNIIYWDIEINSRKAAPIGTMSNLEMVGFNNTGRYGVGYRNSSLHLFDLVTGRTLSTLPMDGVSEISVHPGMSRVAVIRNPGRYQEIVEIDFSDRTLREVFRFSPPSNRPVSLSYHQGGIDVGMENGNLGRIIPHLNRYTLWGKSGPVRISDIDAWNGSLSVSSPGSLILIDSPQLRGSFVSAPDSIETTVVSLPFDQSGGFLPLDVRRGVVWNAQSPDKAYLFSVSDGSFEELFSVSSACKEIYTDGDRLLSLDQNGSILQYDLQNREVLYQYAASGIRDVTFIDKESIIVGRSPSARFPSPLTRINLRTGETVSLEADDLLVYSLHYDPLTNHLYTLGLQERRGHIMTVIQQLQGAGFQHSLPLLSYPGEDHNATFILDGLRLFTSLGRSEIQVSGWDGFSAFSSISHVPHKISVDRNLVASVNSDYSISIWSKKTGQWLSDIYLFPGNEWLLARNDGSLAASSRGLEFVKVFNGEQEISPRSIGF
jgi:WD40 repeat protein